MTPYEIKLLLDIYCIPNFLDKASNNTLLNKTIILFDNAGLLDGVRLSAKGVAHVSQLCGTAWPTQEIRWVNSHGEEI